jgi:DNA-directed RNA polymerase specialized sigma24 family protein
LWSRRSRGQEFESFFAEAEPKLRRALVAAYGFERGREAAAGALAWAWEHWAELRRKDNPVGYIYRIGVRRTRWRRPLVPYGSEATLEPWYEPRLASALASLTERQRVAVVLVYGFEWQLREVAEVCGVAVTTVQNHLERGLAKLRAAMEVPADER